MGRLSALLMMTVIGALMAFQPGINAQLAKRTSVLMAICASTAIAAGVLALVVVVTGKADGAAQLPSVPLIYLVGGLLTVVLMIGMLITLPTLGAAGIVASCVTGQLTVSAVLDHFGALETQQINVTPLRIAGIVLLVAGTALVTSR